ncbi:MAG: SAM-dependent methyltransferase [Anaerolineales bacterium]
MSLKFHEIVEAQHRILNPFTLEKLHLLGEICEVERGAAQLDLACGKGEMLCQWAARHGVTGVGVDLSPVFLKAARARADQLDVADRLAFVQGEAEAYMKHCTDRFDIVSCIGATWIGGGLAGTLDLMKPALRSAASLLLVGEPFWIQPPPEEAYVPLSGTKDAYSSLEGTLDRFERAGLELIEMVLANHDSWDRYEASQWKTGSDWLRAHPDDPDAPELADWIVANRRVYLKYGRRYFGWGVFALRQSAR